MNIDRSLIFRREKNELQNGVRKWTRSPVVAPWKLKRYGLAQSATEALRAFRSFKDIRSGKGPMSCYSLKRLIKGFEETGSLEAKPRSGRLSTCKSVAVTVLQNAEAIETLSTQRMNSDLFCDILVNKLKPGIRNKRRVKLSKGVLFLHDNARPHTSCKTVSTIIKLGFEVLEHPAYSPYLAPSDYFLFGLLKKELKGKRFDSDEDVQKVVQEIFHTLPKSAYKEGIYKLPERWRR
ncbi:hypothetical protein LAZ67_15000398 [Cordylochernes scorpioides]|uniref:Histone-lysine N-methyltransferase SETMAR n=1 Tax=Cordylochernes scorpioides TaxID=51811 RepID=A0ABY6LCU8_9ARAC|nr:hypothetical protein LAZ67_15000398 [Cordylochernes scorpioides]